MKKYTVIAVVAVVGLLAACHNDYTPKPQAYLRIDMPEHSYQTVDTLPFTFEANSCVELQGKDSPKGEIWVDLLYPQWGGVVFLTYKHLHGTKDLRGQTDTSSRLLEAHYKFASGIEEQRYEDNDNHVYGIVYYLGGRNVASTCQFWLTDSSSHFLRGALYLDRTPNNDSLAPVINYMQEDIEHLVETLRWHQ